MTEIKAEMAKSKQIKILDKEDLMNMFKMGRTKFKKFINRLLKL
ncbi:hypothetical protein [Clostridium beijerinckii]|nr:hypothetical protein [Clostridium beijerinckii]MDG5854082.1 hypothetical protein [Clostridium beijerinckii]NOV62566.1 hypothetical protein [Clostridium beijerinckii]NOV70473.1 hypothetical protein [Clostridium beijerinckii]NOW30618.1 hypothetical protein [Clostridium beijerinckii]NOW86848.1 hypothetical protein [Clostridium beijerinckii]